MIIQKLHIHNERKRKEGGGGKLQEKQLLLRCNPGLAVAWVYILIGRLKALQNWYLKLCQINQLMQGNHRTLGLKLIDFLLLLFS